MTTQAKRRLGIRPLHHWLTPLGEVVLTLAILAAGVAGIYAVGALVAP